MLDWDRGTVGRTGFEQITKQKLTKQLCLRGRVLLERLLIRPVSQEIPPFIKTEVLLVWLQEPATGPYRHPDESNLHLPTLLPSH
jgi:hypothetical protein